MKKKIQELCLLKLWPVFDFPTSLDGTERILRKIRFFSVLSYDWPQNGCREM